MSDQRSVPDVTARRKFAEVVGSIGAGVLGVGVGVLGARALRPALAVILVAGASMHVWGMWAGRRIDRDSGLGRLWWVSVLYWACWALLVAFGFASLGMAITSYMKTFQQMDWVNFVMLPMFLFSATFYPVTVYPGPVQGLVKALPLWHGVELIRGLTTGVLTDALWGHVAYYVVMIALGVTFTTRRLRALFLA